MYLESSAKIKSGVCQAVYVSVERDSLAYNCKQKNKEVGNKNIISLCFIEQELKSCKDLPMDVSSGAGHAVPMPTYR